MDFHNIMWFLLQILYVLHYIQIFHQDSVILFS